MGFESFQANRIREASTPTGWSSWIFLFILWKTISCVHVRLSPFSIRCFAIGGRRERLKGGTGLEALERLRYLLGLCRIRSLEVHALQSRT